MPPWLEDAGVYALILAVWVLTPGYVAWRLWQRRRPGRMRVEPVESNLPRQRRERVEEIEGEYRGPGRRGEPFFSPGGLAFLAMLVVSYLLAMWFSDLFRPLGEWAAASVRRALN